MNPVYALLQKLPTNGWTTVLGALLLLVFGITGIATNHLSIDQGLTAISMALTALGLGSKIEKARSEYAALKDLLPPAILSQLEGTQATGTENQ